MLQAAATVCQQGHQMGCTAPGSLAASADLCPGFSGVQQSLHALLPLFDHRLHATSHTVQSPAEPVLVCQSQRS